MSLKPGPWSERIGWMGVTCPDSHHLCVGNALWTLPEQGRELRGRLLYHLDRKWCVVGQDAQYLSLWDM